MTHGVECREQHIFLYGQTFLEPSFSSVTLPVIPPFHPWLISIRWDEENSVASSEFFYRAV